MEDHNYTTKDIARLAGVSAGTVDRVLHNRGDVSPRSREKVQKVLDEINYQPNVFAIGLAAKKKYTFLCLIPYYIENDYWHSVTVGIERARKELNPFNISIDYIYYTHGDKESYQQACDNIEINAVDAVLIAPNFKEETLVLVHRLQERKIGYAFIDFNIEEANALTYIGQDSYKSGYIAAKILMRNFSEEEKQELAVFLSNNKNNPAEIQMQRRLEGFMQYIGQNCPRLKVHEVVLNKVDLKLNYRILDSFFDAHPQARLGAVFNSRIYQLGEYLRTTGFKMKGVIGYDLLKSNVDLLKSGNIHYLIGQRPGLQGYYAIKALCDSIVFKKKVDAIRYMPIDILIKENIDFYFELL